MILCSPFSVIVKSSRTFVCSSSQVSPEELVSAELVVDVHVVPPQLVVDGEHGPVVGVLALGQQLHHNITDE